MMARGHSIEYFIEGGRSRTGRLLKPKTGIAGDDRAQLPARSPAPGGVSAGVISATSGCSKADLSSANCRPPKEKESVLSLLKTIPALAQPLGKVYVSFASRWLSIR